MIKIMNTLRFEIDCTENGPTGHDMTGEPLSSPCLFHNISNLYFINIIE